jgi:hypothetical protein
MKFSNLSSAQLNQIARLIAKKETLLSKIAVIEGQLAKFDGIVPAAVKATAVVGRKGRKRAPGKLKNNILAALEAAGAKGVKVGDLAAKLGVKPGNIFSWFYTTGKKNKSIKKVGEARYALVK